MFMVHKVVLFLSMMFSLKSAHSESYLNTIVNSLEDILKFCVENEHILDVNLLFGVTIVSSQLNFIETREMEPKTYQKLINIKNICDIIFKITSRKNIGNIKLDKTQRKLFSTELWSFDVTPSHLQNHMASSWLISNSNEVQRDDLINSSIFQSKYEFCIRSLIEKCHISEQCEQLILIVNGTEYVSTHQILYLLVLKQLILQNWCSYEDSTGDKLDSISSWLNDKCQKIYLNEFRCLYKADQLLNNVSLADLFIEQVVVCGLQSYAEFFQFKYIDIILKQNSSFEIISSAKLNNEVNYDTYRILSAVHLVSVRIAAMILYVKHISKHSISHLGLWSPLYV